MIIDPRDMENYNFNGVGDEIAEAYNEGYKQGCQETAKDILNGLECFLWETAINDTKYFELYSRLVKKFIRLSVKGIGEVLQY